MTGLRENLHNFHMILTILIALPPGVDIVQNLLDKSSGFGRHLRFIVRWTESGMVAKYPAEVAKIPEPRLM